MRWSLSEFLGLLEIRSQCWCEVDLGIHHGFSIRHSEAIYFYAVLEGETRINGVRIGSVELREGDIAILPSGDSHSVRFTDETSVQSLDFLNTDSYIDTPPVFRLGEEPPGARLLCSRLKVRWPFGQKPQRMPPVLKIAASESIVSVASLERLGEKSGGAALLTRAAGLLFTATFRDSPESEELFRATYKHDPISRAIEIIEKHPFKDWTVQILAQKVGMGRSNFASHFAAKAGRTPIEYVTEVRMKHAVRLLEQTDLKIAAISEFVGYKSEAAFCRRFSGYYGVSPGKARASMRNNEQSEPLG